jgi:hypothetical protein
MSKPLKADELKVLKGQEVWLIPVQNSAKRGVSLVEQIKSGIVEKCGSKMFHLKNYGGGFRFDNGYLDSNNYGYIPFGTKQDALDYLEVEIFMRNLKYLDLSHLDIDDVRKIKEIIENKSQQNIQ